MDCFINFIFETFLMYLYYFLDMKQLFPKLLVNADLMYKWPFIRIIYRHRIKYVLNLFNYAGSFVLDGGFGHGLLSYNLNRLGAKTQGVDFMNDYVKSTTKNFKKLGVKGVVLKQDDLTNLSLKSDSYDFIFCLDVIEHIQELDKAIEEIKRVLKPGGKFIVSAPTENFWYVIARFIFHLEKPIDHYWNADQIQKKMSRSMRLIKTKSIYPVFDFFRIIIVEKT